MNEPSVSDELTPQLSTSSVASRNARTIVALGVGLVALLVAVVAGASALRNSGTETGGADSPEDALEQMLDAIAAEDVLAVAELMLPSERQTMLEPMIEMAEELQRLEVLDPDMDMSNVSGIDFEFDDLEIEATEVRPGMVSLQITGGSTTASITETELPLGDLVLDRLQAGTLSSTTETTTSQAAGDGSALVAVERNGRWFVSLWYTAAETARLQAGMPLPDLSQRISARGATSPEAAVESMITSAIDLDLRRILELLPPDEAEALHDYAPLFMEDAEATAQLARDQLDELGVEIELSRLDTSTTNRRGGTVVFIDGGAIGVTAQGARATVDWNGDGIFATVDTEDQGSMEMTYTDRCVSIIASDSTTGETQSDEICEDELMEQMSLDGLELPDFNIFSETPEIGIMTVEHDGQWFVSPIGTMNDAYVEVLAAIDQAKLAALIDWAIELGESQRDPFAV